MNRQTVLRWSGYIAFAIVFAIACAYLANWQFTRNEERERQLGLIAANYDAEAVPLAELVTPTQNFDPADQWHPVTVVGEYLSDETLLARNRPHGGTSAFEVLVPLRTTDGSVFLVNRGWVPPGEDQPEPDAVPAAPQGEVTVVVRLKPSEPLPSSGRSAPEGQVPTINVPLIADTIGADSMVTSAFGLLVSESPAPATAPALPASPSEDPGPHLSYAIQWILFAIMGFIFIWYMIRTEVRYRREDAEDEAAASAHDSADGSTDGAATPERVTAPARSRRTRGGRPRDRDMQDEDALLDQLAPK